MFLLALEGERFGEVLVEGVVEEDVIFGVGVFCAAPEEVELVGGGGAGGGVVFVVVCGSGAGAVCRRAGGVMVGSGVVVHRG